MNRLSVFENVPLSGAVVAAMQSPHLSEAHLWVVLVCLPDGAWVSWVCNVQNWGYSHGMYSTMNSHEMNRIKAYDIFVERCAEKLGKRTTV